MDEHTSSNSLDGNNPSNGADGNKDDSFSSLNSDKYSRFLIFLRNAIDEVSSAVGEEQYVNYLGSLSVIKKSRSVPGKMQKKLKSRLKESLMTEIEESIKEENLKENLQKLEKLVEDSMLEEGQELWRPNGNVKEHMRSHLMEVKQKHKDDLEKIVREKEQDCECMLTKVMRLRSHVRTLESRLGVLKSKFGDSSEVDRIEKKVLGKVDDLDELI